MHRCCMFAGCLQLDWSTSIGGHGSEPSSACGSWLDRGRPKGQGIRGGGQLTCNSPRRSQRQTRSGSKRQAGGRGQQAGGRHNKQERNRRRISRRSRRSTSGSTLKRSAAGKRPRLWTCSRLSRAEAAWLRGFVGCWATYCPAGGGGSSSSSSQPRLPAAPQWLTALVCPQISRRSAPTTLLRRGSCAGGPLLAPQRFAGSSSSSGSPSSPNSPNRQAKGRFRCSSSLRKAQPDPPLLPLPALLLLSPTQQWGQLRPANQ